MSVSGLCTTPVPSPSASCCSLADSVRPPTHGRLPSSPDSVRSCLCGMGRGESRGGLVWCCCARHGIRITRRRQLTAAGPPHTHTQPLPQRTLVLLMARFSASMLSRYFLQWEGQE